MIQNSRSSASRFHPHKIVYLLAAIIILLVIYIFNASKPGQDIEGCLNGCATSVARNSGGLRVLSLNMLHGFPNFKDLPLRVSLIAEEISRLDADVILLQEVPWTTKTGNVAEGIARQLGYNYIYYRANGNKYLILFEEGEAILTRFPLKDAVFEEVKPRMGLFDTRVVLGATAITPWGDVSLFITHLTDKSQSVGYGQANSLLKFVDTYAKGMAVIAGDFNSQPDTPQITELAGLWIDSYHVAHPGDAGLTCCIEDLKASPGAPLAERIDYIFLANFDGKLLSADHAFDRPFKVDGGWQWASDHTGLIIELQP